MPVAEQQFSALRAFTTSLGWSPTLHVNTAHGCVLQGRLSRLLPSLPNTWMQRLSPTWPFVELSTQMAVRVAWPPSHLLLQGPHGPSCQRTPSEQELLPPGLPLLPGALPPVLSPGGWHAPDNAPAIMTSLSVPDAAGGGCSWTTSLPRTAVTAGRCMLPSALVHCMLAQSDALQEGQHLPIGRGSLHGMVSQQQHM